MNDSTGPTDPTPDVPVTRRRLRDLPPSLHAPAASAGIWNRPDRPKIVGIVGWVTAAIGYVSFILKLSQLPVFFFPEHMKVFNPNFVLPPYTRGQFAGSVLLLMAEAIVGLIAIAGGLGSLKLREWGRRAILVYGGAALVLSVVRGVFQYVTFDAMLDGMIAASTQPIDRHAAENSQFFFFLTSTAMFAVWPAIVLTTMTRRHVRQAFARTQGEPLADDAAGNDWRSN